MSGSRGWISAEAASVYMSRLGNTADVLPDPPPGPALSRDPDDDYVIHLARLHNAEVIITGDGDLLDWPDQDPPVITPAEFEQKHLS
jgi:predicted nucleic acid-binding protein